MRLLLQTYEFQLVYKPGKELHIADALSRAPEVQQFVDDSSQFSDENVNMLVLSAVLVPTSHEKFIAATLQDPTLKAVLPHVQNGWPEHRKSCSPATKLFWQHRSDFSECDGLLLKVEQIVVPVSLQSDVLRQIHAGHLGISMCIERAKLTVYWPNYVDQITNMVEGCDVCQLHRHQNSSQPTFPVPIPDYPFQKVAADLYEIAGVHYLLAVDYFSKWPCAVVLKNITSASVIAELTRFFIDFGIPEQLVSDNGKQFDSAEFRQFCHRFNIRQTTSSPEYPRSNGLVERTVQTVKESFIKSQSDGKTLLDTLQVLRSTPLGNGLPTPAVILQRRNLRGGLLFTSQQLQTKHISDSFVKEKLLNRQATQFFNSAGRKKCLAPLSVGVPVRVRVSHKWIPGIVQSVCSELNSYVIFTNCGRLFRRNRHAINVDKFRCRQLLQQGPDVSLIPSSPATPVNSLPAPKSLNFLEEWQASTPVVPSPPLAHPAVVGIGVPAIEAPEDFMEAFHGFEEMELNPQPARRRGRPKRSRSAHHASTSSPGLPENCSLSADRSHQLVTRSGRPYGLFSQ
jgi:hypothetical protein